MSRRRKVIARCQALTSYYAYRKDNIDRPCTRKASIEGFCTQHHKQHAKVVASRIGEGDVCSFCGQPGNIFRTSRGEGLVMMCDACADAIRRLLTFGEDKRALIGVAEAWTPPKAAQGWTPMVGDRVQLMKRIAASTPVGSQGVITQSWEPHVRDGDVVRPAEFCVDCEGWPAFVTNASNLMLVRRGEVTR